MDYAGLETLIDGLGTGEKNTALEVRTILKHFLQAAYQPGDIKPVNCTAEDIANDYDETGLGMGKRAGWAICNGLNGTQPIGGRTIIGYSDEYPEIGAMDGEKEHQLTVEEMAEHEHDIPGDGGGGSDTQSIVNSSGADEGFFGFKTGKSGGNQPHNNMQPYIVLLYIQKL